MTTKIIGGEKACIIFNRESARDPEFDLMILQTLPFAQNVNDYTEVKFFWETFTTVKTIDTKIEVV